MDLEKIKAIIDLVLEAELTEFSLEDDSVKLHLKRGQAVSLSHVAPAAGLPASASPGASPQEPSPSVPEGPVVKSPMVGTFYRAPSPDSPPFVDVGSRISAETVVCIVEAMKVMNEIQAEVSGTVTEVLVGNGEAVEYGQALFRVQPD